MFIVAFDACMHDRYGECWTIASLESWPTAKHPVFPLLHTALACCELCMQRVQMYCILMRLTSPENRLIGGKVATKLGRPRLPIGPAWPLTILEMGRPMAS